MPLSRLVYSPVLQPVPPIRSSSPNMIAWYEMRGQKIACISCKTRINQLSGLVPQLSRSKQESSIGRRRTALLALTHTPPFVRLYRRLYDQWSLSPDMFPCERHDARYLLVAPWNIVTVRMSQ